MVNLFTLMPRRKDGHGLCIFDLKRVDMARIARRVRMIPHELLSRIHWDPEFGRGEFKIGYLDHVRQSWCMCRYRKCIRNRTAISALT